MVVKRPQIRSIAALALLSVGMLLTGCVATSAIADSSNTSQLAEEPSLDLTRGGAFADQPDLAGGPMTVDQAVTEAILRGRPLGDQSTDVPKTEVEVLTYQEFNDKYLNGSAGQLAPESPVIVVRVLKPFPQEALPSQPGFERKTGWPSYIVAFDPRTALALAVLPGDEL